MVSINEVNLRRARLVLGWLAVSGFSSKCGIMGIFISVCNQSPNSTQPGRPFVGWEIKAGMVFVQVAGETV